MAQTIEHDLVRLARKLAPALAVNAEEAERLGRLPDENIELLGEADLLSLSKPRVLGGAQASLRTQLDVFVEIARVCGSTAWIASTYSISSFLAGVFSDGAQDDYFSSAAPRGAASFALNSTSQAEDDGYVLTGKWPFASGQHHAGWIFVPSMATMPDGHTDIRIFLVPKSEFVVLDDWKVAGMSGTGSNTVALDNVFVPAYRSISFQQMVAGQTAADRIGDDPYYRVPVLAYLAATSAAAPLGMAESAVETMRQRMGSRGITYTLYTRQADAAITHHQMAEATMKLEHARFHAYRLAETIDEHVATGEEWDVPARARCRADVGWCVRLSKEVVDIVQAASGASAVSRSDPLQRVIRDVQTLSVHALLLPSTCAEVYGRVLCGIDPGVLFL